jgi:arylsulfatase A-like enzyme
MKNEKPKRIPLKKKAEKPRKTTMKDKISFILSVLLGLSVLLSFCSCGRDKVKPNILLITIDTLRRDHLGVYGYPRETSPFIDQLAREGMMFKHAITPIPSTAPSHASILTSLHPLTHGTSGNASPLTDKAQTIAEVLKQNGYYTIGTVAVVFLSTKYNFSQGFDSFSDQWEEKPKTNTNFDRIAESVNESLFQQVDEYLLKQKDKNKSLFIWVHYYDPHWPYREFPSIEFKTDIPGQRLPTITKRYDKEIRYTDEHIKKLYEFLKEKGIAKRMITCITADHGEEFGEHGTSGGHADFYTEDIFVPLILHGYCIPKNKVIETYVSTMDIPVTLLGLANLSFDSPTEGINLLETYKKPGPREDRKMLIIGNSRYTRSLQILGYPWSYILNLDHHYKHFFISYRDNFPTAGTHFKTVKKSWIKTNKNTMIVPLPYVMEKGLNYTIFQADIKENKGFRLQIKMLPYALSQKIGIPAEVKTLTIIYPTAVQDRIVVQIEPQTGTIIDTDNLRYAFFLKQELPVDLNSLQEVENEIFKDFPTLRKRKDKDEFFDLAADVGMGKDLIESKKFMPNILEYHKMSYAAYEYYYQKGKKLLKGTMTKENLTEEEKKMLKSLGYL